jgi:hypothetical protein
MSKKTKIWITIAIIIFLYKLYLLPSIWEKGNTGFGRSASMFTLRLIAEFLMGVALICIIKFPRAVTPIVFIGIPLWGLSAYGNFVEDANIIELVLSSVFGIGIFVWFFCFALYVRNNKKELSTNKHRECDKMHL